MSRTKSKHLINLAGKYPPSEPCGCKVCQGYCIRPGWWMVDEAARAISAGYASRMMLELSPDRSFGVLSPAFRGCEAGFALDFYADKGCTFLLDGRCELHGTDFQPLECRFCHHARLGLGPKCHADIEKDWQTPSGRELVKEWGTITDFWNWAKLVYKLS
jgi:hypothetical protein